MKQYVGLDVSMEETKVHILDEEGRRVWRGTCRSHPDAIEAALRQHAPAAVKIGIETGPLTTWLCTELRRRGLPMVCLDARQAKKALDMKLNKTDANDAEGLAHLVRTGWYREVRVKSREAMLVKALIGARGQLLDMTTSLSNQIRGILKTFGLIVPKGRGSVFERNVRALLAGETAVAAIVLPLLEVWRTTRRGRARPRARRVSPRERGVPAADDDARDRRRHRSLVRGRHRTAGELHEIARRRRLARPDTAALSIG